MVADLEQFFHADAREPENLDCCPGPERVILFEAKVAPFAAGRVAGPDLLGGGLDNAAGQGLAGRGEGVAGLGLASGLQQPSGRLAPVVDGARQDREDRQPFAGARVHACLAAAFELALADLLLADGAGSNPRGPSARIFDRPLGQVQVEGTHRRQALPVADPFDGDDRLLAGAGRDGLGLGPLALLPSISDLAGQVGWWCSRSCQNCLPR